MVKFMVDAGMTKPYQLRIYKCKMNDYFFKKFHQNSGEMTKNTEEMTITTVEMASDTEKMTKNTENSFKYVASHLLNWSIKCFLRIQIHCNAFNCIRIAVIAPFDV